MCRIRVHRFLGVGLLTGVLLLLLAAGASSAKPTKQARSRMAHAKSPINLAIINDFTGPLGANGKAMASGVNLAFHDFGSHVAGHAIHVKYYDAESDPNIAVSDTRQALEGYHADVIFGPQAANENGAVSPIVAQSGVPMDDHAFCSTPQLAIHENPSVPIYSSALACDTPALVAAEWAYNTMHWHHMTVVGLDYAFGWLMAGGFVTEFRKLGGTIDKFIWVPISATDLSPYVSSIPRNTQAVFAVEGASPGVRFMDAYQQFGLKGKIPLLGGLTLTDYTALPGMAPGAAAGTYNAGIYCDGNDSPLNRKFTTEYFKANNTYPGYPAEAAYTKVRILINALKRVHGDVANRKAFVNALMNVNITAPRGPVRLDTQFKTPIENMYICQVKTVDGALRNVPVKTYSEVPAWGPLTKTAWLDEFKRDTSGRPS